LQPSCFSLTAASPQPETAQRCMKAYQTPWLCSLFQPVCLTLLYSVFQDQRRNNQADNAISLRAGQSSLESSGTLHSTSCCWDRIPACSRLSHHLCWCAYSRRNHYG